MTLYIRAVHTLTIIRCGRCYGHGMSTVVSELPSPPPPPPPMSGAAPAASAASTFAASSKLIAAEKMNPEAEGATPLMYACQQAREAELKSIMAKKPGAVRERDRTQKSALHYCAENPTVSCAEAVLAAAPELLDARDKDGYTTLHLATIAGNCPLIRLLLGRGAAVNCLDNERHSVVHWATVCGEVEALETVLAAGAEASTPDMHGGYPLHYAAQMCGPAGELTSTRLGLAVLRTLLTHGVEVNVTDQDGRQPILWAASAGSADAILALVNAGANVEADDKDGLTALHCAASRGHTDCLETLVSLCGAAVDVMDSNGCTPLFYAVTLGHADATQLLLEHGAQPNRQDRKGRTPAHCGAAKGQLETLRILGGRGANMWARNVKGDYPLHEAVASGRKDLVRWLLSQRPDAVNASNNDGRCPLHIAAINNNVEMCKILLDHESLVNPVMRSSRGGLMTPLDAALYKGNRGCAKYLQLHGGVPATKLTSHSAALRGILQRGEPHSDQMATPDWGPHLAVPDLRQAQSLVHSPIDLKHLGVDATRTLEVRVEDELHRRGSESSTDDKIKRRRRKKRQKRKSDGSEEETDSSDRHRRRRRRKRKDVKHSSGEESEVDKRRLKTKSKIDKDSLESESEGTPKRKKKDVKHHRRRSVSFDRDKEEQNIDKSEEQYFDKTYEETKITENDGSVDDKASEKQKESRRFLKEEIKTKEVTKSKKVIEHKEKEKSSSNPTITKTSKTTCEETKTEEQITTKTSKIVSESSESKADDISTQESQDIPVQQVVTAIVHQEDAEQDDTNNQNITQDESNQNKECQNGEEELMSTQNVEKELMSTSQNELDEARTDEMLNEEQHQKKVEEIKETDDADFWGENNVTPSAEGKEAMQSTETTEKELQEHISNVNNVDETIETEENVKDEKNMEDQSSDTHSDSNKAGGGGDVNSENITKEQQEGGEEEPLAAENCETNEPQIDTHAQDGAVRNEETKTEHENVQLEESNDGDQTLPASELAVDGGHENAEYSKTQVDDNNLQVGENITNDEKDESFYENDAEQGGGGASESREINGKAKEKGLIKVLGRSEIDDEQLNGVLKVEKINSEILKDRGRERERVRERRRPSSFEIVSPARSLPDEEFDSETPRSRSRTGADSSQLQDSGFEPSPRRDSRRETSRIPRACRRSSSHHQLGEDSDDDRPPLSTISVTQAVQHSMRKYHLERRIFHELLELKRLQIRAGRSNEAVLVKRLVDDYRRAGLCVGLKPYEGVYTFRGFEKYLYDQLRLLQSSDRRIIPRLKSTDDLEQLTRALRKTRAGNTLLDNVPADPLVCTHGTHRCYHATHAYTGVPCAAYIAKINHHTMPKPGAPATSFLPRIDSGKQRMDGQAAEIARCLRYVDPSRPVTLELSHGAERQVISLPTEKLDKNKRYYVTFTIKGGDAAPAGAGREKDKHRHAKSF